MRFKVTLEDGSRVSGEITLPGSPPVSAPARRMIADRLEIGFKHMKDPQHATLVRRLLNKQIPSIAAQLEPHLPRAAPAIRKVQTIEDGGTTTTSTSQRPAMPQPAILAHQLAQRLAPYVVAEQLVGTVVKAQAAHAVVAPAAAAVARHFTARVTELEDRLDQARSGSER